MNIYFSETNLIFSYNKIDIHRTCGLYVLSRRIKHNLKKAVQNSLLRIVDSAE